MFWCGLGRLPGVGGFRRPGEDVDQHGDAAKDDEQDEPDPLAQLRRLDKCADPGNEGENGAYCIDDKRDDQQNPNASASSSANCAIRICRCRSGRSAASYNEKNRRDDNEEQTDEIQVARS